MNNVKETDVSILPPVNGWIRHLAALIAIHDFWARHLYAFFAMLREDFDGAYERQIHELIVKTDSVVQEWFKHFAWCPNATSETYDEELREISRPGIYAEYEAIEDLAAVASHVLRLHQRRDPQTSDYPADKPCVLNWDYEPWQLDSECRQLQRLVQAAFPPSHEHCQQADKVMAETKDDETPKAPGLQLFRAAVYCESSKEEIKKIFNGWRPDPTPRDLHAYAERQLSGAFAARVLRIYPDDGASTARSQLDFEVTDDLVPVQFFIAEGTSKEEAMHYADSARDFIRDHWEKAIVHEGLYRSPPPKKAKK